MIRRQENNGWLLITQPDHAKLAGEMARHWGNDKFSRATPRDEVLFAIAEHDNGWREPDAAPQLNPANGLPYHFAEWSLANHFANWRRGEQRFLSQNRYASLLISRHGSILFRYLVDTQADPVLAHPFFARETWRSRGLQMSPEEQRQVLSFVEEREEFQRGVHKELAADPRFAGAVNPEQLNCNFRLLQVCDALSLYICSGPPQEKTLPNIARRNWNDRVSLTLRPDGQKAALIEPYPFALSSLQVQVQARRLPLGPFRHQDELEEAWQRASLETISFTFRRADG